MDGLGLPRLWRGPVCGGDDGDGQPEGGDPEGQVAGVGAGASAEAGEAEGLRAELAAARAGALSAHRRALLAENAGQVIPELVVGETVEALDAAVEVARAAYEAVRQATIAEMAAAARVGAGNGQRGSAVDVDAMTPMQKIAHGLKRSDG